MRQCRMANVADLSGPYGRLAPSFSGRRTRLPGGRRRYGLRQAFCSTFRYLKLSGVARRSFNLLKGNRRRHCQAAAASPATPSGGRRAGLPAGPKLSEALSARWPGQYAACTKEVIFLIAALPLVQRCRPVRAYGRLAPSFSGRPGQDCPADAGGRAFE